MIDDTIPLLKLTALANIDLRARALSREMEHGQFTRLRRGVYVDAAAWASLRPDERYRILVHATASTVSPGSQFCRESAAALWHLPRVGAWPRELHLTSNVASGRRSSSGLVVHATGRDEHPVEFNNASATSLVRTVVDVGRTNTFLNAVVVMDAALSPPEDGSFRSRMGIRPLTHGQLRDHLDGSSVVRGSAHAARALSFANGQSGSVGESLSRVQFLVLSFPPPFLQVPFYDAEGFIGYADFYWPELDLIGEFDGEVKYKGARYLRGRLPEEVFAAEKRRENRMRRVVRAFERWDWATAMDQRALAARLMPHGLMPVTR